MTPGQPVCEPQIPKSEFADLTEYELRIAIRNTDRNYLRGAGDVDLRQMSNDLEPEQWSYYTALCRALRAKTPNGHRRNDPKKG